MIRNNNLGGTDWAPGELAKSVDLNDTFDASLIKIDRSELDTTEYSSNSTSEDTLVTFTFTPPSSLDNMHIIGFKINSGLKA